ncbi:MAG: hypothetical protein CMD69_05075 [Gammaproteobacteria bacterium]|nr:hypothetical protein [Gammaproteobacteria bacterium]|tara:strand:+ start:774 stop:1298 length:525 start_codon:yes stop_codon:yes gene_type:complete
MIKKIIIPFFLLVFLENIYASNFMQCNFDSALGEGNDEKIQTFRERGFDSCLKCEGNSCKMMLYPPDSDPALFCKRVFCTPKTIRKIQGEEIPADLPIGKSKFEFSYKISEKGRVRDIEIISLEGVMNRRDAYRWTTGLTKRVIYLPVKVNGKTYEINNLSAVLKVNTGVFDGN